MAKEGAGLKELAKWREKIMYNWSNVAIKDIRMEELNEIEVGESYHIEADIYLGELLPEDVMVEAYCGKLDHEKRFVNRFTQVLEPSVTDVYQIFSYHGNIRFGDAGHFGINIRITPNHPNNESRHAMGLVIWGGN